MQLQKNPEALSLLLEWPTEHNPQWENKGENTMWGTGSQGVGSRPGVAAASHRLGAR